MVAAAGTINLSSPYLTKKMYSDLVEARNSSSTVECSKLDWLQGNPRQVWLHRYLRLADALELGTSYR